MTTQKLAPLSIERDLPLLLFIWEWKLATSAAIALKFFPNAGPTTAYNRLLQLSQRGFLELAIDLRSRFRGWTLGRRGYLAIRDLLPALKQDGYKSENVHHDIVTNAVHLGDWLIRQPENAELFTEQQLRRYDHEFYPAWIPSSELHRPDGYWRIPINQSHSIIALEVELSRKRSSDYQTAGEFYGSFEQINRVLWIVPNQRSVVRIYKQIASFYNARPSIHNFAIYQDFCNKGWNASAIYGPEKGKSISQMLSDAYGQAQANVMPSTCRGMALALLDPKIKRFRTDIYDRSQVPTNSD